MKRKRILTLVFAALASLVLFSEMPMLRLYITALVIWVACLLAEEKITLKATLILLYIPVCMEICNWLLLIAYQALISTMRSNAVFMAARILTELIGFGLFVLLLVLRHRKKERLKSAGFLVCTALAFCICVLLAWQECVMLLSPEYADPLLPMLMPSGASKLRLVVRILLYYLPTLGLLLSRTENAPEAETL